MKKTIAMFFAFALVTFSLSILSAETESDYDFNCDGFVSQNDYSGLKNLVGVDFSETGFEDLYNKCDNLGKYVEDYYTEKGYFDLTAVLQAIAKINEFSESNTCTWNPTGKDTQHGTWLFTDEGYYEKRLLCWNGVWQDATNEFAPHHDNVVYSNQRHGDWKVINDPVPESFGKRWLQEKGECYWPLGSVKNPTDHDDILNYFGVDEPRLLCFNGEWYKTRQSDWAENSLQDIFFKSIGSKVGSWENKNELWKKISDDKDDKKDGKDSKKNLILPINSAFGEFCQVDWKCSGWSECSNGFQTRTCADTNACSMYGGDEYNKPIEIKSCELQTSKVLTEEKPSSYLLIGIIIALVLMIILIAILAVNRK